MEMPTSSGVFEVEQHSHLPYMPADIGRKVDKMQEVSSNYYYFVLQKQSQKPKFKNLTHVKPRIF